MHLVNDPIAVEGSVGQHRTEGARLDQQRGANRVSAVGGRRNEWALCKLTEP